MVTVTYFFTISEIKSKKKSAESQMRRIARNIATMQLLDKQDWDVYQNYISQLMAFNEDILYIAIYDDRNTLRAYTLNTDLIELKQSVLTRRMQANLVRQLDQGSIAEESREDLITERVDIQLGDRVLGSVHIGFSIIKINKDLQSGLRLNIGLAIFFLFLFNIIAVYISKRLTRPLEKLNNAMTAVNRGEFRQKVQVETHDEIADLANSFNNMIEGLRERQIIENLGKELSAVFQLEELAILIRNRLKDAVMAAEARLYIRSRGSDKIFYEFTVSDNEKNNYPILRVREKTNVYLIKNSKGFMISSAPLFIQKDLNYEGNGKNGLIISMLVKEKLLGFLFLIISADQEYFSEKQMSLATTLTNQAAIALENALLYEEIREQERYKRELEIARDVQGKLLPASMPDIPGFQIVGFCQSAQEVGGDYFDFFQIDDDHLGIVIADVCGKGISASFYMAQIKGMMLQLTSNLIRPKDLLVELNKKLYLTLDKNTFITMLYALLNIPTKSLTIARAGHNSLLKLDKQGYHQLLTPSGIGLGLENGSIFKRKLKEESFDIQINDTIIFYTDGIIEALDQKNQLFGEERLLNVAKKYISSDAIKVEKHILKSIKEFMGTRPQHDDIAMIVLQRKE